MNKNTLLGIVVLVAFFLLIIFRRQVKNNAKKASDQIKNTFMNTYFTVDELTHSNEANRRGINNQPSEEHVKKLHTLIEYLNQAREIYGKPIRVTSGYRCKELNKAIGGVANSQHSKAEAVDLQPATTDGNLADIFRAFIQLGNYDQLIYEQNAKGSKWVHVSHIESGNRGQIKQYTPKTGYTDISQTWQSVVK